MQTIKMEEISKSEENKPIYEILDRYVSEFNIKEDFKIELENGKAYEVYVDKYANLKSIVFINVKGDRFTLMDKIK